MAPAAPSAPSSPGDVPTNPPQCSEGENYDPMLSSTMASGKGGADVHQGDGIGGAAAASALNYDPMKPLASTVGGTNDDIGRLGSM